MTVDSGQAGHVLADVVNEAAALPEIGDEIILTNLSRVQDLAIASARATYEGGGAWRVEVVAAGRPIRVSRFREGLTRTKAVRQPIRGEDCMVVFTFYERAGELPLTTVTWIINDAMWASVLTERESVGNTPISTATPAGASSASGRRTQAGATRPRYRMTVYRS